MTKTGAKALVRALEGEGVSIVFGYPGGAILPVYDALRDSIKIKHILMRQEQGGVHAASGFARVSGKVGVCMGTSGPGATNLVTGIATAYMDSIPIVIITGQVATKIVGTDAFQEVDITGITHPITKHNYLVRDASDIPRIIKEAFYIASTGRPGPVLIDLPKDIAESPCKADIPHRINLPGYKPANKGHVSQIKNSCILMGKAEKPVILAGGGVIAANATEELMRLSTLLNAPVVTTLMGLGAIPTDNGMNLGMPGIHGHVGANKAVSECDLLIAMGVRFDDRLTGAVDKFASKANVIHIDIDPAEIGKNVEANVPIVGNVKAVLESIIEELEGDEHKSREDWHELTRKWKKENQNSYPSSGNKLTSRKIIQELNEISGGNIITTTDVGQHQMFAAQFLNLKKPKSFISSGGLGTMGYGFPAAIGVQIAKPYERVVCITGDGSFQMSMNELATAKEQGLSIKVLIFNNNSLALVRQLQHFYCEGREMAVGMKGNPDLVKIAEAYGIEGYRITCPSEINGVLTKVLESKNLCIVDCMIEEEEFVYPTVLAGRGIDEMITSLGSSTGV